MNGVEDDEPDLFDDELDELSEAALQALEQNAILSTQRPKQEDPSTPDIQSLQRHLALPPHIQAQVLANQRNRALNLPLQQHLDDTQFDDDSFELVGDEGVATPIEETGYEFFSGPRPQRSEAAQREQFRQHRYGGLSATNAYTGLPQPQAAKVRVEPGRQDMRSAGAYAGVEEMQLDNPIPTGTSNLELNDREAFKARIDELVKERDNMTKELRVATDTLLMQKGEISIIRANLDKDTKIHDRQIGTLKKSMEEEVAMHRAELNALNAKHQKLTAEHQFLQQEYKQELQDTKSLKQRLRDRPQADSDIGPAVTPKRGVASSLRDGFDDDDVMLASPVKSGRRSKPSTPSASNKRKRKADTSPIKPLVLRPSSNVTAEISQPQAPPPPKREQVVAIIRKDTQAERSLRFVQQMFDYETKKSKERLVEALMKFALPSNPSKTFSTIFIEGVTRLSGARLSGDLLQIFVDLWSKCMKEKYYEPIELLIEVTNHILDIDVFIVDEALINSLLPILTTSAALNGKIRFEHSPVNHASFGKFRQTPQSALNQFISGTSCLRLLLDIAYAISDERPLIELFWRIMDTDFVLMMLNAWQPIADISLMLQLLSTSIFESTFGNITPVEQQATMENYIMTRVCYLLWETPKVDEGLPAYSPSQLCSLRSEVMNLLMKVGISSSLHPHDSDFHHGTKLLAEHPTAIARIVRFLYDEVSAMYTLSPTHALHSQLVNSGITLLYHILHHPTHSKTINLQEKLSPVNGGVHKHRVVLTRLAFSDGVCVDRLISDDVVAMATALLEESVTPDEADELVACFPGWKGRKVEDEMDESV